MFTPEGYYVLPNGELVLPRDITSLDIKRMSLSDYAVYRTYLSFNKYPENTTKALSTHTNTINKTAFEFGSGPILDEELNDLKNKISKMKNDVSRIAIIFPDNTPIVPCKSFPPPPSKTYKDYYWDYVNETDPVKSADKLAVMLDSVTMDLEPAEGYKSWVEEPVSKEISSKKSFWEVKLVGWRLTGIVLIGISPEIILSVLHLAFGWSI